MFTTPKFARQVFLFDPEKPRMMPVPPDLTYFISASRWPMSNLIRLEPLTLSRFLRAVIVNLVSLTHYRILRFLHVRLHAYSGGEITDSKIPRLVNTLILPPKLEEGERPWWGALKVVRFFKKEN